MVTERAEELKTVMADNATFIQLPPLGSSTSLITVYGDNRVNIQRTIRSIMQLVSLPLHFFFIVIPNPFQACQFYVGSFWLLPVQFNALLPPALNTTAINALLQQISMASGAEVVFKSMCFEMHGLEHEVRTAVNMIMELDIIKVCCRLSFSGPHFVHDLLISFGFSASGLSSRDSLPN